MDKIWSALQGIAAGAAIVGGIVAVWRRLNPTERALLIVSLLVLTGLLLGNYLGAPFDRVTTVAGMFALGAAVLWRLRARRISHRLLKESHEAEVKTLEAKNAEAVSALKERDGAIAELREQLRLSGAKCAELYAHNKILGAQYGDRVNDIRRLLEASSKRQRTPLS